MFAFFQKCFFTAKTFISCNALNTVPLKCVSMNNQECKIRPKIMNINSNEPLFYPYSILVNKCSGSCNNINDPYTLNNFYDKLVISRIFIFKNIAQRNYK